MSQAEQTLLNTITKWRNKAVTAEEEALKLAQENDELRALVLRQLLWLRDGVRDVMTKSERAWVHDAEALMTPNGKVGAGGTATTQLRGSCGDNMCEEY